MATPVIDQLLKDLAFKIFDPVASGGDDGKIFTKELRMGYLNRAYGNMIRLIEALEVDKTRAFKSYYKIYTPVADVVNVNAPDFTVTTDGYTLPAAYDVIDVYYSATNGGTQLKANRLEPENFLLAKNSLNSYYTPSTTERYWSLINNKIMFLPSVVTATNSTHWFDVSFFVRDSFENFVQGGTVDMLVPGDYKSLLIITAAMEAMADKGDVTKYQLYGNAFDRQMQIMSLKARKQQEMAEEGQK